MIDPETLVVPDSPPLELWPGSPRYISWSQISKHWECAEKYRLSYRTDLPKQPSGAMLAGSAVHEVIDFGERAGWWSDEALWRGRPAPIEALAEQAFVVAFGRLIAGVQADGSLEPPWADRPCPICRGSGQAVGEFSLGPFPVPCDPIVRVYGLEALRWSGRLTIVEDERGKVQRLEDGVPVWRDRRGGPDYAAARPRKNPGPSGKLLDDLAAWVMAREDARWWIRNGPLMIRRAGAVRRRDRERGLEVIEGATERRIEIRVPFQGRTVPIVIIPDLSLMHQDGEPRVRDYKTGAMIQPLQLAFYAWGLSMLPEGHPLRFTAEVGEIAALRSPTVDGILKEYDLRPWLPLMPGFVEAHLEAVAAEVERDSFELKPSSWCASCDVRAACSYGSTLPERAE